MVKDRKPSVVLCVFGGSIQLVGAGAGYRISSLFQRCASVPLCFQTNSNNRIKNIKQPKALKVRHIPGSEHLHALSG